VAPGAARISSLFSAGLEAAKPTNIFFSSKLTEPRANQQGKRVRIFRKYKLLIFVQIIQLLKG
jgi:hypothetical protein